MVVLYPPRQKKKFLVSHVPNWCVAADRSIYFFASVSHDPIKNASFTVCYFRSNESRRSYSGRSARVAPTIGHRIGPRFLVLVVTKLQRACECFEQHLPVFLCKLLMSGKKACRSTKMPFIIPNLVQTLPTWAHNGRNGGTCKSRFARVL